MLKIKLTGKKGCIVSGTTHAVRGIEAREIGNAAGANTEVSVGVHQKVYEQISQIDSETKDDELQLQRIEEGLIQFETIMRQKGLSFRNDPRRMALVKEKVRLSAQIAGRKEELEGLQQIISASNEAYIQVVRNVYPGVRVRVDEQSIQVQEPQKAVEFKKYMGRIGMFNIGYTAK